MAWPANRRATYEDLRNVPSHLVPEIIDGEFEAIELELVVLWPE